MTAVERPVVEGEIALWVEYSKALELKVAALEHCLNRWLDIEDALDIDWSPEFWDKLEAEPGTVVDEARALMGRPELVQKGTDDEDRDD
jgi:hypothetical protein